MVCAKILIHWKAFLLILFIFGKTLWKNLKKCFRLEDQEKVSVLFPSFCPRTYVFQGLTKPYSWNILCSFLQLTLFYISVTVNFCRYKNRTFGINQSVITENCKEICGCSFINGNPVITCKFLCQDEEDLKCDPFTQIITNYQAPVNGTNCVCTKKKCVSGKIPCQIYSIKM